jgi:hypothetical protein
VDTIDIDSESETSIVLCRLFVRVPAMQSLCTKQYSLWSNVFSPQSPIVWCAVLCSLQPDNQPTEQRFAGLLRELELAIVHRQPRYNGYFSYCCVNSAIAPSTNLQTSVPNDGINFMNVILHLTVRPHQMATQLHGPDGQPNQEVIGHMASTHICNSDNTMANLVTTV